MDKKEAKKIGTGYVSAACRNVGLKSTNPFYAGMKRLKEGASMSELSLSQKQVIEEYNRLISE